MDCEKLVQQKKCDFLNKCFAFGNDLWKKVLQSKQRLSSERKFQLNGKRLNGSWIKNIFAMKFPRIVCGRWSPRQWMCSQPHHTHWINSSPTHTQPFTFIHSSAPCRPQQKQQQQQKHYQLQHPHPHRLHQPPDTLRQTLCRAPTVISEKDTHTHTYTKWKIDQFDRSA